MTDMDNKPRDDLERALVAIEGATEVLRKLALHNAHHHDGECLGYLANRLVEHHDAAHDAFSRIFKLDEYSDKGGAA
jgi:hypothetical protein